MKHSFAHLCFSSSPVLNLASHLGYAPNESITPDTSFHQDDPMESAKQGIEPKNLMGVIISSSASFPSRCF